MRADISITAHDVAEWMRRMEAAPINDEDGHYQADDILLEIATAARCDGVVNIYRRKQPYWWYV